MSVIYKTLKKLRTPHAASQDRAVMVHTTRVNPFARKKGFYSLVAAVFVAVNIVLALGIHYGLGQFDDTGDNGRSPQVDPNLSDTRLVVIRKSVKTEPLPDFSNASYLPPVKKPANSKVLEPPKLAKQTLPPIKPASHAVVPDADIDQKPAAAKNPLTPALSRPVVPRSKKTVEFEPVSDEVIQKIRADKVHHENVAKSLKVSRLITRIRQSMRLNGGGGDTEMMLSQLESIKGKNNSYVLKLRAFWYIEKGEYDRALPLLEQVAGRNEKDLEAGYNLAVLEIKTNQLQAARRRLTQLSQMYPENNQVVDMLLQVKKHTRAQ